MKNKRDLQKKWEIDSNEWLPDFERKKPFTSQNDSILDLIGMMIHQNLGYGKIIQFLRDTQNNEKYRFREQLIIQKRIKPWHIFSTRARLKKPLSKREAEEVLRQAKAKMRQ